MMKYGKITTCILLLTCTSIAHAQESCYEQYLREHNMKVLTAEDIDDNNNYDELKKEVIARQLEEKYGVGSVAISNVMTEKGFRQDWRAMASSNIKEVNLNYHGSNQAIHLDYKNGEYITSTGLGTTRLGTEALNVRDIGAPIGNIMNARLNLNTCHSASEGSWLGNLTLRGMRLIPGTNATLIGTNQTIMECFFNNFNFSVVRGTSAGVSYNRQTKQPEPQFFFQSWIYLFHK